MADETVVLDTDEYWEEPAEDIRAGDVFDDVPLIRLRAEAGYDEDERIWLPTSQVELSLLLKKFSQTWWFVPIVTEQSFGNPEKFHSLFGYAVAGRLPGWFPLPPLHPAFAELAGNSLVCSLLPTTHRPDAFDDAQEFRVASLTQSAYDALCRDFEDGFTRRDR